MKTFETEKNNIPEGATHYSEEQTLKYFCWYIITKDSAKICRVDSEGFISKWHDCTNEHNGSDVKPIPKPEVVEWKNGDECLYMNCSDIHVFIGLDPRREDFCYIQAPCYSINFVEIAKLSKPESPEDKEKRERLEAAYDLYCDYCAGFGIAFTGFEMFCHSEIHSKVWLAILNKTNYRKGE